MATFHLWFSAMAVLALWSLALFFSHFSATITASPYDIPKLELLDSSVDIETKSKGTGYPGTASSILQGRRMMSSTHQEDRYREPVRPSHSSNPAHSDPGKTPGKPNLQEGKYREPVRPSHSSNPAHSDPGMTPGKPNLQEGKHREPVRPSHSSDPAHSDPGKTPGKPNL